MKREKIKDERVVQLNNKIQSEAYYIVLFLTAASIFVKAYVMERPFQDFLTELIILIVSTLYIALRGMLVGHDFIGVTQKSRLVTVLMILLISLAMSILNGVKNYTLYGHHYTGILDMRFLASVGIMFVTSAIFTCAVFALCTG